MHSDNTLQGRTLDAPAMNGLEPCAPVDMVTLFIRRDGRSLQSQNFNSEKVVGEAVTKFSNISRTEFSLWVFPPACP